MILVRASANDNTRLSKNRCLSSFMLEPKSEVKITPERAHCVNLKFTLLAGMR